MKQIIFDIETKRTFNQVDGNFPEKLGVSFVGVCVRDSMHGDGEMLGFFEHELEQMFPLFEQADMLIGFNSDHFDIPALVPYYSEAILKFPSLDLLARFKDATGHRIKLDIIAKETLGKGKSGDGLDAIKYYESGQLDKLKEYCLMDVAITRDIYDYGMKFGKLKYKNKWNRLIETPVDFSFKSEKEEGMQMTLI
ncbi:MAG: ribonuclease H-like domain-containing protein [Patescibacteria group bacterium]